MFIGLTFDVRRDGPTDAPAGAPGADGGEVNDFALADDLQEEFDAPTTIEAIAGALRALGHDVELIGDGEPALRRLLDGPRPELVFNFAEGEGVGRSREARIPAVLEMLGIPYTGSDPLTLAVALDKECAKRLVRQAGWMTPDWVLIDESTSDVAAALEGLRTPILAKPSCEGSSKGILGCSLMYDRTEAARTLAQMRQVYRQPILVEEFIDGEELTVGLLGNRPASVLGIMRVVPLRNDGPFVYGLEVKRDWRRLVEYEVPARLSPADISAVERAAFGASRALGCRDVARVDFRLQGGVPWFIEANPLPGLSPTNSDLVFIARGVGVEYRELIRRIVDAALARVDGVRAAGSCAAAAASDRP